MKNMKFLMMLMLFVATDLYADGLKYAEEDYKIQQGETLSSILYSKGVHGGSHLYGTAGNDGYVTENKELNPQIKNWNALHPGTVIKIKYPSTTTTSSSVDVEENYLIQEGDTLSGVLYSKGTKGIKNLYAKDGYVEKNKKLNPSVANWEKLVPGTTIRLVYKGTSPVTNAQVLDAENKLYTENKPEPIETKTPDVKPIELKTPENTTGHFLEHRFFLGLGVGYDKENQTTQSISTRGALTFPILQYQLYYRPVGDPEASSWEYRFLAQANKGLAVKGVSMPFGGQVEVGFGRYSLFKFGTTRFNPNIDLSFDIGNTFTSDASDNFSARERHILWFGFKPELVSYIGSTMVEYYPFVYKSLYMKSMDDKFSGWKFGLKADVGLAFKNALYGSVEYNYERHENQVPTVVLSLQELIFGVGYRF